MAPVALPTLRGKSTVIEQTSDVVWEGRDVIELSLDRVAFRFISMNGRYCGDECFRTTEDQSGEVAMALSGAIAGFREVEFSGLSVWTAVVIHIDEVKLDDPRPRPEDHRRLKSEEIVNGGFEFICRIGVQLSEGVIVELDSASGVSNGLDGFPIDSGFRECSTNNPRFEAAVFDSGNRYIGKECFR
ncbi:hypothetical protein [Natronomonas marina]|uniref:hypothetical protein n=1 Tax=Natronomonas marina TaxID=2961939 RepID=UPI0020C9CC96|nr:hypothetical protein [Natronomonas marina]